MYSKCVITHIRAYEISKIFSGGYTPGPPFQGEPRLTRRERERITRGGGRGREGGEGRKGERGGAGEGNVMGLQPPQFLNSVHAPVSNGI